MTSFFIACTLILPPAEVSEHNKAAIAFLRTHQTASGGFATVLPPKGSEPIPSLRTTRTALRAFQLLGGSPADREAVVKFLKACHDPKVGGFADRPGAESDPISTSVGLMILADLKLDDKAYRKPGLQFMAGTTKDFEQIRMVASSLEQLHERVPQADDWLKLIDRKRNADGSYGVGPGRVRSTALYVVALQRLGGKLDSPETVLKILRAGQRADGGFGGDKDGGSDLESCYRIVRLFSRLKARPDQPEKLRAFINRCRNTDGGYATRPNTASSLHGTYYAAIVTHWLDS